MDGDTATAVSHPILWSLIESTYGEAMALSFGTTMLLGCCRDRFRARRRLVRGADGCRRLQSLDLRAWACGRSARREPCQGCLPCARGAFRELVLTASGGVFGG